MKPSRQHVDAGGWLKRGGWMLAIWTCSVGALGIAAYALRLVMRAVGMGN
jgi:hypothetical protein